MSCLRPRSLAPACLLLALAACPDDTTTPNDDEVGDSGSEGATDDATDATDESGDADETGDSESTSTDATDDTTDDSSSDDATDDTTDDASTDDTTDDSSTEETGLECDLPSDTIDFALTGAMAPPNGCNDFTFTGHLSGGDPNTYYLDTCPCGVVCLVPDPYTMTYEVPNGIAAPQMPACPIIHFRRDPDTCEPVSMTIGDLDDGDRPIWIAGRRPFAPPEVAELEVLPVDLQACPDLDQYALEFGWDGNGGVLQQGDQFTLPTDDGDWTVHNWASRELQGGPDYAWVMKRP